MTSWCFAEETNCKIKKFKSFSSCPYCKRLSEDLHVWLHENFIIVHSCENCDEKPSISKPQNCVDLCDLWGCWRPFNSEWNFSISDRGQSRPINKMICLSLTSSNDLSYLECLHWPQMTSYLSSWILGHKKWTFCTVCCLLTDDFPLIDLNDLMTSVT